MPVCRGFQVFLYIGVIACKVICHYINYDLYTVFVSLGAKTFKLSFCTEIVCSDRETEGLIEPPPCTALRFGIIISAGLCRRCLYSRKSCFCNIGKFVYNISVLPVKAMKDNTVLDIFNIHRIIMLYRLFC